MVRFLEIAVMQRKLGSITGEILQIYGFEISS